MIELSDIKNEIINAWNKAKEESGFEFRAICNKYTGDTNINQHIQETIVSLKDYRDDGGLGNLYINTFPKPNLFDDQGTAIYHIGILSDDNLHLIANYYYEHFKKWYKESFESDNKKEIKDILYRCCFDFFVKIQTAKRLSDLQDKVKEKNKKPQQIKKVNRKNYLCTGLTEEELTQKFILLKKEGYLHQETDLKLWINIFDENGDDNEIYIKWTGDTEELGHTIESLFGDFNTRGIWVKTSNLFTVKGEKPNIQVMKNAVSKYKNENEKKKEKYKKLDKILNT